MYGHCQKIGKPNDLKVFEVKKTKAILFIIKFNFTSERKYSNDYYIKPTVIYLTKMKDLF